MLLLLLAGCDEREDNRPPPTLGGFSQITNPLGQGKTAAGSELPPEDLRTKQLASLKAAQEAALKAQEALLKKHEKEKQKAAAEAQSGKQGRNQPALASNKNLFMLEQEKKANPKERVKVLKEINPEKSQLLEINNPGQPKPKTKGNTVTIGDDNAAKVVNNNGVVTEIKPAEQTQRGFFSRLFGKKKPVSQRGLQTVSHGEDLSIPAARGKGSPANFKAEGDSTETTERISSALDELQLRTSQPPQGRSPPERHTTVNSQLSEIMARSRLQAQEQEREREQEKDAGPAQKKEQAGEADLSTGAPAAAPEKINPQPQPQPETAVQPPPQATDDESLASNPDEATLNERYQAGLTSRDLFAREASFQYAAFTRRADALPQLSAELKQDNVLAAYAAACLGAIGQRTAAVEDALLHGLSGRDAAVREACAAALGSLRSRRAVQPLIETMKADKNFRVRCACLTALGLIGDHSAAAALRAKLAQSDEVEFVQSSAALALARLGDAAGRDHLIRNAESPEPALQVIGMMGLAQLNEPFLAGYLTSGLESNYEEVWTTAVLLLAGLGPAEALPVLRPRLDARSETIRRRAALALGFLGSDEALPYLERAVRAGGLNERVMGCELLARLNRTDKIPLLLEKLHDPHTFVRQAAAVALAQLNALEALPALLEAARGPQDAGALPPALRGAGPDVMERLTILACVRSLHGEKEELFLTSQPNRRDNSWPEVDRLLAAQQIELVKLYQFVDVVSDGARALGVVLKLPEGRELMFREGEHVASGFKVREICLPAAGKDKAKNQPCVILMRGADRIILAPGRPAEVELKKPEKPGAG